MFFIGHISVDPSEMTNIHEVEPKSTLKKLLKTLSLGKISEMEEEENFTAVSIIHNIHNVLLRMGVQNVIRIAHNDKDYYLDSEGEEDDLNSALDKYTSDVSKAKKPFKSIALAMESEKGSFYFYIEIHVKKSHKVGEFPIKIRINALMKEFFAQDKSKSKLKSEIDTNFRSPDAYEFIVESRFAEFKKFLKIISEACRQSIAIDDLKVESHKSILLPSHFAKNPSEIDYSNYRAEPIFHGYYGSPEKIWYTHIWTELCGENNIYINNCRIYNERGTMIGELEDQGIEAGDSLLFDIPDDD